MINSDENLQNKSEFKPQRLTEALVAAEEKKAFQVFVDNKIEVLKPHNLNLSERYQIARSYNQAPSQAALKQLAIQASQFEELTKKEVRFAISGMSADREKIAYQENIIIAEGQKKNSGAVPPSNTLDVEVRFNRSDINNGLNNVSADGKTSEYGGRVLSQPFNQNELSELRTQFTAMNDFVCQQIKAAKDKNNDVDVGKYSLMALIASSRYKCHPSIQLSTLAIDQSRNNIHDRIYGNTADTAKRHDETKNIVNKLSPRDVVYELNNAINERNLNLYGSYGTKGIMQFNSDEKGVINLEKSVKYTRTVLNAPPLSDLTTKGKPVIFDLGDGTDPTLLPGLMLDSNNILYPSKASQLRDEFINSRLKEAFPQQYDKIGVRFEMYALKDESGNVVLGEDKKPIQAEKPIFFVKPSILARDNRFNTTHP
jgi:hypothetical protein